MCDKIKELETLIVQNLHSINTLKNEVEKLENAKNDQLRDISLGIIDIIDSFEAIEESLMEDEIEKSHELIKATKRYKTIQKMMLNLLKKYGITKIEFPENRMIVGLCDVVDREPDNNRNNDEIVSVVRNGYSRGKDLIRAAQIIIVKN